MLYFVEPRTGDLQGDPSGAQPYILAMDPYIEQLVEEYMSLDEELLLQFQLPHSTLQYNMGYATYADDIATLKIARIAVNLVRKLQQRERFIGSVPY
eukprot:455816-Heterocapsa_arctica.AAC.1